MARDWTKYRTDGILFSERAVVAPVAKIERGILAPSVDLRSKCSPVEDQTTLPSCGACATVGALEYLQRKLGQTPVDLSVLYVYYNGRQVTGTVHAGGAFLHHYIAGLLAYGACAEALWPYRIENELKKPTPQCYEDGEMREALKYARVNRDESMMQVLSDGFPIVVATNFGHAQLDPAAQSGRMQIIAKGPYEEGHSMLLVGYDQAKREWLVRNSWGDDYGMAGYLWIPFDTLVNWTGPQDFWMVGDIEASPNVRLVGASLGDLSRDVQANGADEVREALARQRKDLNRELQDDLADAKTSARSRLRDAVEGGIRRMADRDAALDKARRDDEAEAQKAIDRDRNARGGGRNDGGDDAGGRGR